MASGEPPRPEKSGRVRVVVADDHPLFRAGLVQLLNGRPGFRVVGETADGQEAIEHCRRFRPELLLTDVRMPRMDGLEVARDIQQEFPHIVVMILTALEDPDYLSQALSAGAKGYILKYATAQQIVDAIRKVLAGEYWLDQGITTEMVVSLVDPPRSNPADPGELSKESSESDPVGPMTPREVDVLRLLVRGQTNQEIADNLFVGLSTVKKYVNRLFKRLGVSARTQVAVRAIELGLLPKQEEGHE